MAYGERGSTSTGAFIVKRIVPWFVLLGIVWYTYGMGRTYMSQEPQEEANPMVATETVPAKASKVLGRAKVISETLNFRTKPSTTEGTVTQRLDKGTVLSIVGQPAKDWLQVQTAQGQTGYVFSSNMYVQVTWTKKKQ